MVARSTVTLELTDAPPESTPSGYRPHTFRLWQRNRRRELLLLPAGRAALLVDLIGGGEQACADLRVHGQHAAVRSALDAAYNSVFDDT